MGQGASELCAGLLWLLVALSIAREVVVRGAGADGGWQNRDEERN